MCGRYSQTLTMAELAKRFGIEVPKQLELPRQYNVAPTQLAPVVALDGQGRRKLDRLRWGLIPGWAKDEKIGHKTINARSETAHEKPSFRKAFSSRRCLVLADGFYEWKRDEEAKAKFPYRIRLKGAGPFAMAGLWERWKAPDGRELKTFTILTTRANEAMAGLHDRMPVILRPEDEQAWLAEGTTQERCRALCEPCAGDQLELYPVSALVNSPKNDVPACLAPLTTP
jgi:putative SOS response-associated peptidase YedK